jgi:hypothetical protein
MDYEGLAFYLSFLGKSNVIPFLGRRPTPVGRFRSETAQQGLGRQRRPKKDGLRDLPRALHLK